jgi:hypothetical protein
MKGEEKGERKDAGTEMWSRNGIYPPVYYVPTQIKCVTSQSPAELTAAWHWTVPSAF